ncbi:restriction endonuclease subunit S [Filobacillus milosensis]|uniref:restriction endonuclease subunit S n=1 Tax=Filobacillus milosensis TaxID=94137 RepID=UPI001890EED1|nr:restriction endonuclease subunit S [Filobacillus milosensis]
MKFKEFCTFKEGYVNPSQKEPKYFDGPIKWLRATDLNNSYVYTTTRTLTEEGFKSARKSALMFKPNTISISKSGTVGRLGILKDYMCGNRAVINIDVNSEIMNMEYIFYWLLNNQNYIKDLAVGSVQRNLYVSVLENLEIEKRPIFEQKAIANILSTIDKKIEINNQMNERLEEMAQVLFKRWFVDFEFPNDNGESYKSSGGEMIESELGMIPKGWEVSKLNEHCDVQKGLSYKGKHLVEDGTPMLNLGNINPGGGFRREKMKYYDGEHKDRHKVKPGDIIIANTDMTQDRLILGSPIIVPEFNKRDIIFTHHLFALRQVKLPKSFLYYYIKSDDFRERAESFATGTTVLAISKNAVVDIEMVIPQSKILNKYKCIVDSILDEIALNNKENVRMEKIRDLLLPKLMSGEIRVPIDDNIVEEQVNN